MIKATSKNALRSQSQGKLLHDRTKIINCLKRHSKYGCTRGELSVKTGIALQTICWRIRDLLATGMATVEGTKVFKKASSQPCESIRLVKAA